MSPLFFDLMMCHVVSWAVDRFLDLMATQEGGEDTFGIYETECLYITNPSVADDLKKVCDTRLTHCAVTWYLTMRPWRMCASTST